MKEKPTTLYNRVFKINMVKISIILGERDETLMRDIYPVLIKDCTLDGTRNINLRESRESLIKQFTESLNQLIKDYERNFL